MRTCLRASVLAVLAIAAAVPLSAQKGAPPKAQTRKVFVSVTDRAGAPVLDLGPADFEVHEATRLRTVVAASVGKTPMRIALFVDTSDGTTAALTHMRAGLLAFLDAIPADAEAMIITTGRQVRVRQQPTTDRKKLKDLAAGLFSDGGATPLMDGLLEIDDRFFKKTTDRWPVLVILTGDGAEGSNSANEKKFSAWLGDLPVRAITAHAFAMKYHGGNLPDNIAQHVVETAGGRFDYMNTSNGLPDKMKALGELLASDAKEMSRGYEVEFETNGDGTDTVRVGVERGRVAKVSYKRPTSGRF